MKNQTNSVTILRKVTIQNIDITLSQVQFGKRVGYQTNWFESGKSLLELVEADRLGRIEKQKEHYRAIGHPYFFTQKSIEKFNFYFPTAKGESTAAKHFQKMVETAPSMTFEIKEGLL